MCSLLFYVSQREGAFKHVDFLILLRRLLYSENLNSPSAQTVSLSLYTILAKFRKSAYCLLASIFLWYLIKISKFQFTFPFLYWNNWDRTFWHCNYINLLFGFCYVVHFIFVWEYCIKDNSCNWCNCKSWKADYYSSNWEWNCSINSA